MMQTYHCHPQIQIMAQRLLRPFCGVRPLTRSYHQSLPARSPYKDSEDRDSLKTGSAENTKLGRDDQVSDIPETAFSRGATRPEQARKKAAEEGDDMVLEGSGANQELSKPQGDEKSSYGIGPGKETSKGGTSGGPRTKKQRG